MILLKPKKPRPKGKRDLNSAQSPLAVRHGFYQGQDGTQLFYSVEGEGLPLIFCYGLVCSSLHWTYQIEYFSKHFQTVWFDYRGHQNSEVPKDFQSLKVNILADDLNRLLEVLKIEKAIFLGHSMGVNVVLEFYKQYPEKVAGMILANGTAKRPLETLFNSNFFQGAFKVLKNTYDISPKLVETLWKAQKGNPLIRTLIGLGGFNPHLTPKEDIELYVDQVADLDPRILLYLIQNYDDYDATSWLHQINVPTLLLGGELDKIIPASQQKLMHQLIPKSELLLIQHGSHCPQMDLPELVNLKFEDFINRFYSSNTTSSQTSETSNQSKTQLASFP